MAIRRFKFLGGRTGSYLRVTSGASSRYVRVGEIVELDTASELVTNYGDCFAELAPIPPLELPKAPAPKPPPKRRKTKRKPKTEG